jgi:hypothetical protein
VIVAVKRILEHEFRRRSPRQGIFTRVTGGGNFSGSLMEIVQIAPKLLNGEPDPEEAAE